MSEKSQPESSVTLDVESETNTAEGRQFLRHIVAVSRVLQMKDTQITFKGEELLKISFVGDCKSVQLFKCPTGYFLFCNKSFTKNNWSAAGKTVSEVVEAVYDPEVKSRLAEGISAAVAAE